MPNLNYFTWKRTDKLIKDWIIDTLSKEILAHVIGIDFATNAWNATKFKFAKATMDRELTLYY